MDNNTIQLRLLKVARNGINWDVVMDHLLQTDPQVVLNAVMLTQGGEGWEHMVIDFANRNSVGGKVPTIKFARDVYKEYTGEHLGLKDAKDWVENNCAQWNGGFVLTPTQYKTPAHLKQDPPLRGVTEQQVLDVMEKYSFTEYPNAD